MDHAIPLGQRFGIGLDAILGLVPGVGDVAGGLVSALIILHAHRRGVPRITLLRMLGNVGIDTALGSIPVLGDIFDVAFESNTRNVELIRRHQRGGYRSGSDWLFVIALLLGLAVIVSIPILAVIWVLRHFV